MSAIHKGHLTDITLTKVINVALDLASRPFRVTLQAKPIDKIPNHLGRTTAAS
jgi:hypothetical protein